MARQSNLASFFSQKVAQNGNDTNAKRTPKQTQLSFAATTTTTTTKSSFVKKPPETATNVPPTTATATTATTAIEYSAAHAIEKQTKEEDETDDGPVLKFGNGKEHADLELTDTDEEMHAGSNNDRILYTSQGSKPNKGLRNQIVTAAQSTAQTDFDESGESDADVVDTRLHKTDTKRSALVTNVSSKKKSKVQTTHSPPTVLTEQQLLASDNAWKEGASVPYAVLCQTFASIEAVTGRLQIQNILTTLFRLTLLLHPQDLLHIVYLASNSVAPAFQCVELGVGDSILIKSIGEASGTNPSMIKLQYESEGDLGTVANNAKAKQTTLSGFGIQPKPLLASEVLAVFRQIAITSGTHSQKWKVDRIKGLLVRAQQGLEARFIIRGLQGKLRIGLAQSTVLISLAHAFALTVPSNIVASPSSDDGLEEAVDSIKKAYSQVPSYDAVLEAAFSVPVCEVHKACTLRPGIPVAPMLAKPTKSIHEVLKRLNGLRFTCEFKYDGERAQVHMMPDGVTKVFSRSLLDTSEKFPEVPQYVKESCVNTSVNSFVLDTEVVAYNRETNQFVPFQVLSTRKKTEESDEIAKVKVIVQAFDLMFLNGVSLLDRTLAERRDLLKQNFLPVEGKFQFASFLDHTEDGDTTMLEEFLDTAVKKQCEGLMVKTLDENAAYEPSRRSLNWLKLKKDYLEGLGDSFDLVPIGAYYGRGKRTGVYGAYLLACYDEDTEEYQSVCKIGTGFSDQDLKTLATDLNEHIILDKSTQYNVSEALKCDIWFDAVQVWEVKAADLSKSSIHKGAIDKTRESGRGIGLRFPRFGRLREDKKPEQATSSDQILEMYYAQESIVDNGTDGNNEDDGI